MRKNLIGVLSRVFGHSQEAIPSLTDIDKFVIVEEKIYSRAVSNERDGCLQIGFGVDFHAIGAQMEFGVAYNS